MTAQTVIAALALIFAVVSLLWQAITYTRSGARFEVDANLGILMANGGLATFDEYAPAGEPFPRLSPEEGRPVLVCTVRNAGRLDGSIVRWSVHTDGRPIPSITPGRNLFGPYLPLRISHEDRATLVCELESVQGLFNMIPEEEKRFTRRARVVIETGGGKVIQSLPITIPPGVWRPA